MNKQGSFIATLLDTTSKAFAVGAVLRVSESGAEAAGMVSRFGFNELVKDTELRLRYLAEALACGRREVLALDVEWLSGAYSAREIPIDLLRTTLDGLRDELKVNLPADASAMAAEYLDHAIATSKLSHAPPASCLESNSPFAELTRGVLLAVLEGERLQVERLIMGALDGGALVTDIHAHVLTEVQRELGRMWQVGEIHVAEEHFGSRIVEDMLVQLRNHMPRQPQNGLSVLLASVAGNLHDIGPRLVADQFEMQGWRSIFLGANMPITDLVRGVDDFEPRFVALSVGQALQLRSAANTIAALRVKRPELPILVGGAPFGSIDDLWRDLGADGFANNAAEAIEFGQEVLAAGDGRLPQ
jgi:methanogenic corrinoid protein MtbC1